MDIHDLKVFAAVARHLHYTRAARDLGLSQPAVSARIACLEKDLGTRLLQRAGRGMALTPAGEVLAVEAGKVLGRMDAARQAVEEVKGLLRGRLRIGASTTPGIYLVPRAAARFSKRHPGVTLEVRVDNTLGVEEAVHRGDLHAGVVGGHLVARDLRTEPLCDDELVVFASPDHALARKRVVEPDELLAEPFAMRERGSATRDRFERWCAERAMACRVGVEFGSPEAVKHAVAEGAWLGVLSRLALAWELEAGRLREVKVRDFRLVRSLRVVFHDQAAGGRAVEEWLKVLRETLAR
ncbi:MAG TPA: LysR substrate-binding domain-containing protein [Planctomycetota bacterium]|nr:LysR substrate-binding domain-containing protein [Planctomycetota bacterium]